MKMKGKRYKLAAALTLISAIFLMKGLWAYFTDQKVLINTLTPGHNTIEIQEEFEEPGEVEPGKAYHKKVEIKNTGPVSCYTRVRVLFSDSCMEKQCELDWNTKEWEEENGWYYYKELLSPQEVSTALFTQLKLKEDSNERYDFSVTVYAESCQYEDGMEYKEAWKLFEKNKGGSA